MIERTRVMKERLPWVNMIFRLEVKVPTRATRRIYDIRQVMAILLGKAKVSSRISTQIRPL